MAGGRFISTNKIRPGAYINFQTTQNADINVGTRGIVTMALPLDWGEEQKLIEVSGADMLDGNSLAKVGLTIDDPEALLLKLALQNCDVVKVFNKNSGGTKASTTLGSSQVSYELTTDTEIVSGKTYYTRSGAGTEQDPYVYTPVENPSVSSLSTYYEQIVINALTVTAKYPGTFGNKIAMLVKSVGDKFSVETYANGYLVDTQLVASTSELKNNNFVEFSGDTITAVSSTLLQGGVNGSDSSYLTSYFGQLRNTKWNTLAYTDTMEVSDVVEFIRTMREDEGKYVQAVVANYDSANYEGIINNVNGVVLDDGTTVDANNFTIWVAGATAGASIVESITGKVVEGAKEIVGLLTNSEIEEGLTNGKFILSFNQAGNVKVEKDINSLHTFTIEKNYIFSKNRVIRELDEIGAGIEDIWETTYLGKVSNNEDGRTLFRSSIINYLSELESLGALSEFDAESVTVEQGDDIDSVIATVPIKPVDSMEFLYFIVNVEQ